MKMKQGAEIPDELLYKENKMTNNIKQFLEADALRTGGAWENDECVLYALGDQAIAEVRPNRGQDYHNANFIAAASRIAPDIRNLLAAFEQVCDRLADSREAIASLPEDALGYCGDEDSNGIPYKYPLQAELLYRVDNALTAAAPWRKQGGV